MADGRAGELARVTRLVPVATAAEFARYPPDLLRVHAAAASGRPTLAFADTVRRLVDPDALHDLVLVRGSGGLAARTTRTPYDEDRHTLVDLAHTLGAPALVVAPADGLDPLLLVGVVPVGAADWTPRVFRRRARTLVVKSLRGSFDARALWHVTRRPSRQSASRSSLAANVRSTRRSGMNHSSAIRM